MATSTGLSQLGQALMQGTGDYANIQLRRQAEERARAQQIADLQDQRRYAEGQQAAGISRQKELALWQARQARIQELITKGFLAQADAADDMKVAAADAAEQARSGTARTQADTARVNMQDSANSLGQQLNELYDAAEQVQTKLASIPTAPRRPDPRQIEQTAVQLATEAGEDPANDAVRVKYRGAAEKILSDAAMRDFFIAQEASDALKVSLNGYSTQIAAITNRLGSYEKMGIVPTITPPAAALQQDFGAPPPQPRVATPEERAAAAGMVPQASVAAPVPSPAAALQDPGYGGIMGFMDRAGPELRTLGTALADPIGAAEIGLRGAVQVPARALNLIAGGDRRLAEGEAERAAGMADALSRFNAPRSVPNIPSFMGYSPAASLSKLPPLPPMRKPSSQSPAFLFSNSYAPGN